VSKISQAIIKLECAALNCDTLKTFGDLDSFTVKLLKEQLDQALDLLKKAKCELDQQKLF